MNGRNPNANPGKNATLYKTHKQGIPVRLLTSGCNTAIENLACYLEVICAPLTERLRSRIKNTDHLLQIIDCLNINSIPDGTSSVSFDIVNMYPSIDNRNGLRLMETALNQCAIKEPPTECLIEALNICLFNNNSRFGKDNLLQTNGTASGAPNSCSYADIAVSSVDDGVYGSDFQEILYFGWYRDDCICLWHGTTERLDEFFQFINTLSLDLKFTMELGGNSLCFLDLKITLVEKTPPVLI